MTKQRNPKPNELRAKTPRRTTTDHKKKAVKSSALLETLNAKDDRRKPTRERPQPAQILTKSPGKVKQKQQIKPQKAQMNLSFPEGAPLSRGVKSEQQPGQTRRVSFILRLTVGPRGELGRTEIEHVSNGKKQNFPDFSPQDIDTFVRTCISPNTVLEAASQEYSAFDDVNGSLSKTAGQSSGLTVFDALVFHVGVPDFMTLLLRPAEPFVIQTRFKVHGSTFYSLTSIKANFGMRVYAHEVTSGRSKLLTIYTTELNTKIPDYEAVVTVSGLQSGLYRLYILMKLGKPPQLVGFYDRIIIHVI